jgi:hypothetical protein
MTQTEIRSTYTPHEGQALVHASRARTKVLKVGRRWGKSRCALYDLLDTYGESLSIPVGTQMVPPFHAWVVVPNYPQGRQTWNEMVSLIPSEFIAPGGIKQEDWIIYLRGSDVRPWGMIEMKSAHDPDALQTVGLDFLWTSESQDIPDAAFHKLLPTLRSPGRMSRHFSEGIPATYPDHWFERQARIAERGNKDYFYLNATAFENPFLTEEDRTVIRQDRDLVPDAVWRRMYLAEFSVKSAYFANIDACITGDLYDEPIPGSRYVGGLDLGRKLDPSVLYIMDAVQRKVVYRRSFDAGTNWTIQKETIRLLSEVWGLEKILVDATGIGDVFCEELRNLEIEVEEYIFTWWSRDQLLSQMVVATERETVHFPPVEELLRQLRAFQLRKQPSGNFKAEVPNGEHDDDVFACALALHACDPPLADTPVRRWQRMRYMPTQAEAGRGTTSTVRNLLKERAAARIKARWEESGISDA